MKKIFIMFYTCLLIWMVVLSGPPTKAAEVVSIWSSMGIGYGDEPGYSFYEITATVNLEANKTYYIIPFYDGINGQALIPGVNGAEVIPTISVVGSGYSAQGFKTSMEKLKFENFDPEVQNTQEFVYFPVMRSTTGSTNITLRYNNTGTLNSSDIKARFILVKETDFNALPWDAKNLTTKVFKHSFVGSTRLSVASYLVDFIRAGAVPQINGDVYYFSNVNSPVNISQILTHISASDAEDGDLTSSIMVVNDQYTANKHIIGTYPVMLYVEDSDWNGVYFTFYVSVVDVSSPVITGPTAISVLYTNTLTDAQILSQYVASDNYDGNLTSSIVVESNGYIAYSSTVGTYQVVLKVTDSSGNIGRKTVSIVVTSNSMPVFTVDGHFLVVPVGVNPSIQQIVDTLIASGQLPSGYQIVVLSNTYSTNFNTPGKYNLSFRLTGDGEHNGQEMNFEVMVVDNAWHENLTPMQKNILVVTGTAVLGTAILLVINGFKKKMKKVRV